VTKAKRFAFYQYLIVFGAKDYFGVGIVFNARKPFEQNRFSASYLNISGNKFFEQVEKEFHKITHRFNILIRE
jgi:hypothetical protein